MHRKKKYPVEYVHLGLCTGLSRTFQSQIEIIKNTSVKPSWYIVTLLLKLNFRLIFYG